MDFIYVLPFIWSQSAEELVYFSLVSLYTVSVLVSPSYAIFPVISSFSFKVNVGGE